MTVCDARHAIVSGVAEKFGSDDRLTRVLVRLVRVRVRVGVGVRVRVRVRLT